jgi:DcaP outer membrane protein
LKKTIAALALLALLAALPAAAQQATPATPVATVPEAQDKTDKKDEPSHPAHPDSGQGKDLVEKGLFPKSINIPGTDASFGIGGYVKVDFIQDKDAIGNAYDFQTSSIPVAGSAAAEQGGRTTIHARESRINLELRAARKFRAFVEGDFYGDKNAFRLRHAYGEFGRLLGGQTWSTFQDISARPLTIDFEGPDGEIFVRQALLRWAQPVAKGVQWALAVENPTVDIAVPSGETGVAQADLPDFVTHLRWTGKKGHGQLGGILRKLRFDGESGSPDQSTTGWGLHASFNVKPFGKDELLGQLVYGEGIAHYVEALAGQGSDAVFASGGGLEALPVTAAVIGFTHHWSQALRSGVSYAFADLDNGASQSASAIRQTQDFRVNLLYTPYRLVDLAWEVLWGRRENKDGSHGEAVRGQFAVIYRFN